MLYDARTPTAPFSHGLSEPMRVAWYSAIPSTQKLPEYTTSANAFGHQVRLTGQQRLVHIDSAIANHDTIDYRLVARTQPQHITTHQFRPRKRPLNAVA